MSDHTVDLDPYNPDAVRTVAHGFDAYSTLLADVDYDDHIEDLARDYMHRAEDDDWDPRVLNHAVAHWANLVLNEMFEFNGRLTTTRYNEQVIIEWDSRRNPTKLGGFVVSFREQFHVPHLNQNLPDDEAEYIDCFRATMRRLIISVVQRVEEQFDRVELENAHRNASC